MSGHTGPVTPVVAWIKNQILDNSRVIKYGLVGCFGILVNLGVMTLSFTMFSQRGWVPSAIANVISTVNNFILHNIWTFSDRRHQGLRMVRGFLSFAVMSSLGILVTTVGYVGFTHIAVKLSVSHPQLKGLAIVLPCQFFAILLGASFSYVLNREFTWAGTKASDAADPTQAQEI